MKKRKLKKKMILPLILFIIFSLIKIIIWFTYNNENKSIKNEIDEYIQVIKEDKEDDTTKEQILVDFDKLTKQNEDAIAYLKVNGTNIDYVVVKGNDNEYYLKHNFNRNYNDAGWIFADFRNTFTKYDKNIVIFGHNTIDGSMFGTLRNILNKSWYTDSNNHIITLITKTETLEYKVFSTYMIEPEEYYINTQIEDSEFDEFIKTLKKRSFYNYNTDISKASQILTLSTCINNASKRVVLHAAKIDE